MAYNKADAASLAQVQLGSTALWPNESILYNYVDSVVNDIQIREPKQNKTYLTVINNTKFVDLTSLTGLIKILGNRVENPPGDSDSPSWKNFRTLTKTKIELDVLSKPAVTETTLTGTVTFTISDATVSGVATAFDTELAEGDFIKKSSGTRYYRVASITSATALELEETFGETTGADTVNLTIKAQRTGIVAVYWGGPYTVSASASDMPTKFDELLVLGMVAYALLREAIKKVPTVNVAAGVTNSYEGIYDRRWQEYQRALSRLGRPEEDIVADYPKG